MKVTCKFSNGFNYLYLYTNRDIASLQEYILISSTEILVEKNHKQAYGNWILHEYKTAADTFTIATIGLDVLVGDLYRGVVFDA